MIVKKFQAPTEVEAILKAKEELGNSAVVLNVKSLRQRGVFRLFKKDVIEITAALEENEFAEGINQKKPVIGNGSSSTGNISLGENAVNNAKAFAGTSAQLNSSMVNSSTPRTPSGINLVADDNVGIGTDTSAIEQKLDSLQTLLKKQMSISNSVGDHLDSHTVGAVSDSGVTDVQKASKERENINFKYLQLIYKKLIDNDVAPEYADGIISDIENSLKRESNIDSILAAVYQKIILKLGETRAIELGEKTKVVLFIGPTGVGKTTTIAKIASKFKLEQQAKVAFITSDTYRIAAVEQLNTYASIIDCPVSVVYTADELLDCIDNYSDYDLIMVDTAGRSHKAEEQMEELEDLIGALKQKKDTFDLDMYLTLSVTTKYKDLTNIADRYKNIDDWGLIFTKLDETCVLGNIFNVKLYTGAPLAYTTSGQNVPNDIEQIDKQALAKLLLGGNE